MHNSINLCVTELVSYHYNQIAETATPYRHSVCGRDDTPEKALQVSDSETERRGLQRFATSGTFHLPGGRARPGEEGAPLLCEPEHLSFPLS